MRTTTSNMTTEEYRLIKALREGDIIPIWLAYSKTWHCSYIEKGQPCPFGAEDIISCFKYHRVMDNGK